jgi:hypothetical protein
MKVQDACDLLNSLIDLDREAVIDLLTYRIPCNINLVEHPKVMCREGSDREFTVSVLGLLQAFIEDGIISYEVEIDEDGHPIYTSMKNFLPFKENR